MENTLVRAFVSYDSAQKAREELVAAGFERSQLELSVQQDEAGAVSGNFTVGDHGGEHDAPLYERDFAQTDGAMRCILTVATYDDEQLSCATGIMARHGAYNPDPLTRANGVNVIHVNTG
ncbi:MAG: hypothetical protein ABIT83_11775 [Massilia sp.]